MLENSKMLPLPANVDCNAQSTFSQRSVKRYSQRYSQRCENAGRGSIFEFSSIKSKKNLYFLLFMLENSKMLPLPAFFATLTVTLTVTLN